MLLIQSEKILSANLLNVLIRFLESLYDVFLGWIDMHIIGITDMNNFDTVIPVLNPKINK